MISITKELSQQIIDLRYELGLGLAEFAIEKDFHVVTALETISKLNTGDYYKLVFCGGTCLSKAYALLDRMSEDVDFKLIPTPALASLSKTSARSERKAVRQTVLEALSQQGFEITEERARDDYNYQSIGVGFRSIFPPAVSMRPEIKLELNSATLALPTETRPTGRLFEYFLHGKYQTTTPFECISLEEALVEKLVSFPRRLASEIDGESKGWDQALVRHLYDVHRINAKAPQVLNDGDKLRKVMHKVIEQDGIEFPNHVQFLENPKAALLRAMDHAASSRPISNEYTAFCKDMVYDNSTPSFEEVVAVFRQTLTYALPAEIDMNKAHERRKIWLANKAKAQAPTL